MASKWKIAVLMVTVIVAVLVLLKQNHKLHKLSPDSQHSEQPTDSQPAELSPDSQQAEQPPPDSQHTELSPDYQQVTMKNVEDALAQYTAMVPSQPISKDLIVHSVYFDDRTRNGHSNVSVFLVVANRTIFDNNWIVGCRVGDKDALEFIVRFTAEGYLVQALKHRYLYEEYILECYDLPVVNGSQAYVMYKTAHNSPVYVVESLRPLFIPAPRITHLGEHNISVVTCTKAFNKEVTWLPEFVRYQKTIGVDHVHVNIIDTFIKDGGLRAHLMNSNLMQAVKEGFVSLSVWPNWYNYKQLYNYYEALRKLDCIYQFRGTYDYVFSLDTDDFFNPQIPGMTNVKDFILNWCYDNSTGSCSFEWVYYFPGACGVKDEPIDDGNVTRVLRSYARKVSGNTKSIHRTSAILDATFHDATCKWALHVCLMPGYKVNRIPLHIAYVAHNRMHAAAPKCDYSVP